jgi:two-component system, NarL family, response regulator NreC
MTPPIRILLADDHAMLRTGLATLLNNRPDMMVVGEATDGLELLPLAEATQPDVILLDLTMPRLGGLEVLPLLQQVAPHGRVLILTMHQDEGYLRRALKSGASGYLLKKAADVELITAIQAIMRGDVYLHPSLTRLLIEDELATPKPSPNTSNDLWHSLSEREQEVLRLVALGHTSKEIADQLAVSAKTVDTYRARGMDKLELRSRAALVRFALAHGLLDA